MRPLVVLGATGSIGRQTIEVAERLGVEVAGVAAARPSAQFEELLARHPGAAAALAQEPDDRSDRHPRVAYGAEAVAELAAEPGRTVLNGIVGAAGLAATLAAAAAGNRVALANKESMVTAGALVSETAAAGGGEVIPVDSEHSALFQCLAGEHPDDIARLVLTASGGPFRGRRRVDLADVTPADALRHPTWEMGGRITVDSATLVNKGLEVIEAHFLFGVPFDRIGVVVHPQSIVHSAVEFVDGALKAHLGFPDMRIPIQYALTYPRRASGPGPAFALVGHDLHFEEVDRNAFPALDLAYAVGRAGGSAPSVYNAADEVAVAAFLAGRIGFNAITDVVAATVSRVPAHPVTSVEDVVAADAEARAVAAGLVDVSR